MFRNLNQIFPIVAGSQFLCMGKSYVRMWLRFLPFAKDCHVHLSGCPRAQGGIVKVRWRWVANLCDILSFSTRPGDSWEDEEQMNLQLKESSCWVTDLPTTMGDMFSSGQLKWQVFLHPRRRLRLCEHLFATYTPTIFTSEQVDSQKKTLKSGCEHTLKAWTRIKP